MWIAGHFDPSANSSMRHAESVIVLPAAEVDDAAQWSSIIGIATAITGNVLISFALNIQRYAHIRIERDYQASLLSPSKAGRKANNEHRAIRTTAQEQIAEERAQLNARSQGPAAANKSTGEHSAHGYGRRHRDMEEEPRETSPLLERGGSASTGVSLEKRSVEDVARQSYLKSPYWWAGIILMAVGETGNFLAYGFAPASIVSPLGVVALIVNCIIAPFMLKERFRVRDALGVFVAIGGAVTVVLSAKSSETKLGQHEILGAILRWEFLTYVCITAIAILALGLASPRYGDHTILIDLSLVGLFGGYTALSTKGVASLLSDRLWMILTFPITYLLVAVLVISALLQIHYLNRALQRFDSTQVIPTQFVLFTLSVIVGSAVLYRDFESTTGAQAAKFVGGCLLTFFGVYLITTLRPEGESDDDDDVVDEEAGIHLTDDEVESQDGSFKRRRPRTPTRRGSEPTTPLLHPHHYYTPTLFGFPSSTASLRQPSSSNKDQDDDHRWLASAQKTPNTPDPPSPFTRAQSNPPHTSTFARLRATQSHQYPLDNNYPKTSPMYLRSPAHPGTATSQDPLLTPTSRPGSEDGPSHQQPAAAEAALRAHLGPWSSPSRAYESRPVARTFATGPPSVSHSARGSISRLLPGPLSSPLSAGLSAVVADSLRRKEGSGVLVGSGGSSTPRLQGRQGTIRREKSGSYFKKRPSGVQGPVGSRIRPRSVSSPCADREEVDDDDDQQQVFSQPNTSRPADPSRNDNPQLIIEFNSSDCIGNHRRQDSVTNSEADNVTRSGSPGQPRQHHHHRKEHKGNRPLQNIHNTSGRLVGSRRGQGDCSSSHDDDRDSSGGDTDNDNDENDNDNDNNEAETRASRKRERGQENSRP